MVLVANAANPYSRGLRVARSLAGAGFAVEIAAVTAPGVPDEEHDGEVVIHRYRPSGRWAADAPGAPARTAGLVSRAIGRLHRGLGRIVPPLRRLPAPTPALVRKTALWPLHVRGWWATLRRELPPADLYHAFGILTIGGRPRAGAGRAPAGSGRTGRLRRHRRHPRLEQLRGRAALRSSAWYRWRERRWVRRADAIVTVNEPIADHLVRSWRAPDRGPPSCSTASRAGRRPSHGPT